MMHTSTYYIGKFAYNNNQHENAGWLIIKTSNQILISLQAKGLGYAINTSEELKFVKEVAAATGVVLDPVYRYA